MAQRPPDQDEAIEVATDAPEDAAAAAARQMETDVQRLLDRARAAAARGDFGAAIEDAYAALLRKLEGARHRDRRIPPHQRRPRARRRAPAPRVAPAHAGGGQQRRGGAVRRRRADREPVPLGDARRRRAARRAAGAPAVRRSTWPVGLAALLAGCSIDRDQLGSFAVGPRGRRRPAAALRLHRRASAWPRCPSSTRPCRRWCCCPAPASSDATGTAIATGPAKGGTLIVAGGERTLPEWIGARRSRRGGPADGDVAGPADGAARAADRLPRLTAVVPGGRLRADHGRPRPDQEPTTASDERRREDRRAPVPMLVRGKTPYAVERTYEGGGRAIVLADDRLLTQRFAAGRRQRAPARRAAAPGRAEAGARPAS